MSMTTYISSALLILIVLISLLIFARSAALPLSMRCSQFGWIVLALYLCCVLGALLFWGRDAETIGIAVGLLGLPWSALSAFVLNGLLRLPTGLFGATWETTITVISFGAIVINGWLAYQLGQRLPALWIIHRRSS